ncbi:hypothetical protein C8J56DRAFT_907442, partial [Mycena floridula]
MVTVNTQSAPKAQHKPWTNGRIWDSFGVLRSDWAAFVSQRQQEIDNKTIYINEWADREATRIITYLDTLPQTEDAPVQHESVEDVLGAAALNPNLSNETREMLVKFYAEFAGKARNPAQQGTLDTDPKGLDELAKNHTEGRKKDQAGGDHCAVIAPEKYASEIIRSLTAEVMGIKRLIIRTLRHRRHLPIRLLPNSGILWWDYSVKAQGEASRGQARDDNQTVDSVLENQIPVTIRSAPEDGEHLLRVLAEVERHWRELANFEAKVSETDAPDWDESESVLATRKSDASQIESVEDLGRVNLGQRVKLQANRYPKVCATESSGKAAEKQQHSNKERELQLALELKEWRPCPHRRANSEHSTDDKHQQIPDQMAGIHGGSAHSFASALTAAPLLNAFQVAQQPKTEGYWVNMDAERELTFTLVPVSRLIRSVDPDYASGFHPQWKSTLDALQLNSMSKMEVFVGRLVEQPACGWRERLGAEPDFSSHDYRPSSSLVGRSLGYSPGFLVTAGNLADEKGIQFCRTTVKHPGPPRREGSGYESVGGAATNGRVRLGMVERPKLGQGILSPPAIAAQPNTPVSLACEILRQVLIVTQPRDLRRIIDNPCEANPVALNYLTELLPLDQQEAYIGVVTMMVALHSFDVLHTPEERLFTIGPMAHVDTSLDFRWSLFRIPSSPIFRRIPSTSTSITSGAYLEFVDPGEYPPQIEWAGMAYCDPTFELHLSKFPSHLQLLIEPLNRYPSLYAAGRQVASFLSRERPARGRSSSIRTSTYRRGAREATPQRRIPSEIRRRSWTLFGARNSGKSTPKSFSTTLAPVPTRQLVFPDSSLTSHVLTNRMTLHLDSTPNFLETNRRNIHSGISASTASEAPAESLRQDVYNTVSETVASIVEPVTENETVEMEQIIGQGNEGEQQGHVLTKENLSQRRQRANSLPLPIQRLSIQEAPSTFGKASDLLNPSEALSPVPEPVIQRDSEKEEGEISELDDMGQLQTLPHVHIGSSEEASDGLSRTASERQREFDNPYDVSSDEDHRFNTTRLAIPPRYGKNAAAPHKRRPKTAAKPHEAGQIPFPAPPRGPSDLPPLQTALPIIQVHSVFVNDKPVNSTRKKKRLPKLKRRAEEVDGMDQAQGSSNSGNLVLGAVAGPSNQ